MVVGRSLASLVPKRPGGGSGRCVRGVCRRLRHHFSSFRSHPLPDQPSTGDSQIHTPGHSGASEPELEQPCSSPLSCKHKMLSLPFLGIMYLSLRVYWRNVFSSLRKTLRTADFHMSLRRVTRHGKDRHSVVPVFSM